MSFKITHKEFDEEVMNAMQSSVPAPDKTLPDLNQLLSRNPTQAAPKKVMK